MHSSSATQELLTMDSRRVLWDPSPVSTPPHPLWSWAFVLLWGNPGADGGGEQRHFGRECPLTGSGCAPSRPSPLQRDLPPPKLPIPGQRTTQDQLAGHGEPLGSMRLPPPLAWAEEGLVAAWISLLPWGGADLAGPRLSSGPLQFCPSGML
jgi:hypothetical protein